MRRGLVLPSYFPAIGKSPRRIESLSERVQIAKGFRFAHIMPYIGVDGSYNGYAQTVKVASGLTVQLTLPMSAPVSVGAFGYGAFGGIELVGRKTGVYLQVAWESVPVKRSPGLNLGGVLVSLGLRRVL